MLRGSSVRCARRVMPWTSSTGPTRPMRCCEAALRRHRPRPAACPRARARVAARLRQRRAVAGADRHRRRAADTRIAAIDAGADDHLDAPFDPRELVARCRALVRRNGGRAATSSPAASWSSTAASEVRHGSVPGPHAARGSILEYRCSTRHRRHERAAARDHRLRSNSRPTRSRSTCRGCTKLAGTARASARCAESATASNSPKRASSPS